MTNPVSKPLHPLWSILLFSLVFGPLNNTAYAQALESRPAQMILGWIEPVYVQPLEKPLEAKIDSGADHSSLHATDIEYFEKNQKTWVRFHSINHQTLNLPLLRNASIKRKDATVEKRPVVKMRICFGQQWQTIAVNLVGRAHFQYSMLIGRSALPTGVLIDPNRTRLTQPQCTIETPMNPSLD